MIDIKVNLTNFHQQMKASASVINAGSREGLLEVLTLLETSIKQDIPVASGTAKKSIHKIMKHAKNGWLGTVTAIGTAHGYITYIEEGRLPGGFPPPDKIRKWLMITARGRAFVRSIAASYNLTEARALRAATFLKSRAIARFGTRGKRVFAKALRRHRGKIEPRIRNAIRRRLAKVKS